MRLLLVLFLAMAALAFGQYPTYPGCNDLKDSDFKETKLLSRAEDPSMDEPMKMDFYQDAQGNVNIYWIERGGAIKYYDAAAKTMKPVGHLEVLYTTESGLQGIALDPDFKSNRRIFFYWAPVSPKVFRISRFNLKADNTLDNASEKVILDIPDTRIGLNVHNGGALHFDKQGNLWVTVGEHDHTSHEPTYYHNTTDPETSGEDEAPDTYSLYGSLLKIHPEPDGSYTIPKGNFGEFWSAKFKSQGRNVLSAKYADPNLVRREIYVKGFRDAMTVQVDNKTGWAVVSDCGAQCHKIPACYYCPTHGKTEKTMLITEPSFQGWNYFIADNFPYAIDKADERNPLAPVNNSPFRKGVDTLPPAVPGTYMYGLPETAKRWPAGNPWICSLGGFMYRYDADNPSRIKLPPHFEGRFFMKDQNQSFIRSIEVDAKGAFVKASTDLFSGILTKSNSLDMRQGPDGALYLLNYAKYQYTKDETTGIFRIEYAGDCKPVALAPSRILRGAVAYRDRRISVSGNGRHWIEIDDLAGNRLYRRSGEGNAGYAVDLPQGVYLLRSNLETGARKIAVERE